MPTPQEASTMPEEAGFISLIGNLNGFKPTRPVLS